MLEELKEKVYAANMELTAKGLVTYTWGNASGIDADRRFIVIKPSGVEYAKLRPEDMAVVELSTGERIEGGKPSSDTPTHLELYRRFAGVGGVVHTHSRWATVFAQMRCPIPPLGTTHADYFHGPVPCTRPLTDAEISGEYELETGRVIAETFAGLEPTEIPAVLVCGHGPFTWGQTPGKAAENAVVLEEVAFMAWHALAAAPELGGIQKALLDRHYFRKHGKTAYYGQGEVNLP